MTRETARILHVTSNGTGMGHLARQAAIALANPGGTAAASRVLSLSTAAPLLRQLGVPSEYVPGFDRGLLPRSSYDAYLADRVDAAIVELDAQAVVLDAVTPHQYPGVLMAVSRHPRVAAVWCRRGFWRPGYAGVLGWSRAFDLVLEPGDFAGEFDEGDTARTERTVVRPISLVDRIGPLPRTDAAAALGLDPDRPAVLISLGSGATSATAAVVPRVLNAFADRPDWQVVMTSAPIAAAGGGQQSSPDTGRVTVLRGVFPLARYHSAFDLAIMTAGYNAVHELLPQGVPTVFTGNPAVLTDDQDARAVALAMMGLARYVPLDDPHGLVAAVVSLLSDDARAELRTSLNLARAAGRLDASGAADAVAAIGELVAGFTRNTVSADRSVRHRVHRRSRLLSAAGSRATSWGMSTLGRTVRRAAPPVAGPARPLVVTAYQTPGADQPAAQPPRTRNRILSLTSASDPGSLQADPVVEDVWPGASEAYLARRRRIIDRYYRARWVP